MELGHTMTTHRFIIETGLADYPCDDYIIRPFESVDCIMVENDTTDHFQIFAAVTAIHDYGDDITLDSFPEYRLKVEEEARERAKHALEMQTVALNHVEDQRDVQ